MNFFKKKRHLVFLIFTIFIILFIYKFPDIYAYVKTPKDMIFLGQNPWFDWYDVNVYASAIRYGQMGHVLLPNLYTSLPNKPVFIYPLYTFLGFIFRMGNPFFIFFFSSIITGIIFIIGYYYILRNIGFSPLLAAFSCIIICLSGGFGFLRIFFLSFVSSDVLYATTFYDAFLKPHEAIGIFLYTLSLMLFFNFFIKDKGHSHSRINLFFISASIFFAMIIYPYLIITYVVITFVALFFWNKGELPEKSYLNILILYLPASSMVLIMANQFAANPAFNDLFQHLSTEIVPTMFGYGILLPLFLFQLFIKKTSLEKYLLIWITVTFFFALLPFGPGKIFLRGLYFPLGLLGIFATRKLLKKWFATNKPQFLSLGIVTTFFLLIVGSNFYIFLSRISAINAVPKKDSHIYMTKQNFLLFSYLNAKTISMSAILGGYTLSSQIPAFTHNVVYLGVPSTTSLYTEQLDNVLAIYAGKATENQFKTFLKINNISYIIWGTNEKRITAMYYAKKVTSLTDIYPKIKRIYQTGDTDVYAVN